MKPLDSGKWKHAVKKSCLTHICTFPKLNFSHARLERLLSRDEVFVPPIQDDLHFREQLLLTRMPSCLYPWTHKMLSCSSRLPLYLGGFASKPF